MVSASSEYRDAALSGLRDNICRSKEGRTGIMRGANKDKADASISLSSPRMNCEVVVRMVTKDTGGAFNRAADRYTVPPRAIAR